MNKTFSEKAKILMNALRKSAVLLCAERKGFIIFTKNGKPIEAKFIFENRIDNNQELFKVFVKNKMIIKIENSKFFTINELFKIMVFSLKD